MEKDVLLYNLFLAAAGLLIALTLGMSYLSWVKWRDRRRQDRDKQGGA